MPHTFGWELPPGCHTNDPTAPWNNDATTECLWCSIPTDGSEFCSPECKHKFESARDDAMIAAWESLHESRYY